VVDEIGDRGGEKAEEGPENNEVHHTRKRLSQDEPLAQHLHNEFPDKRSDSSVQAIQTVVRPACPPQKIAPIECPDKYPHGDGHQDINDVSPWANVPEYFTPCSHQSVSVFLVCCTIYFCPIE